MMKQGHSALPVDTTIKFRIQFDAAPRAVQIAVVDALELFETDPHHPSLNNHALRDTYAGFRSINITPDWRALFKEVASRAGFRYVFYALGTHKQLYGN